MLQLKEYALGEYLKELAGMNWGILFLENYNKYWQFPEEKNEIILRETKLNKNIESLHRVPYWNNIS